MRFRFVHAADLHLDTPFEGISTVSPEIAEKLRDASLDSFDALIDFTIASKASFLLLAGDIYDGSQRGVRAQLRFKEGMEKLSSNENNIPVFIIHGNHDPIGGWSAINKWPPGVTIFDAEEVTAKKVTKKNTTLATVYGISYGKTEVTENLALRFQGDIFAKNAKMGLQIGLLHCNVDGNSDHGRYSPCSSADLRNTKIDYWALGHIHKRQELGLTPRIEYPGNLQGRSLKSSEGEPKGALLVEVNDGTIENIHFEPLDKIRFLNIETDISEIDDLDELQSTLLKAADRLKIQNPNKGLVIRTVLKGRGKLHRELRHGSVINDLLSELREKSDSVQPFIWWDSLLDQTSHQLDLTRITKRKDFSAELIQLANELLHPPFAKTNGDTQSNQYINLKKTHPELAAFLKTYLDKPLEKSKIEHRIPELSEEEIPIVLNEALYLALDLMEEQDED